MIYVPCEVMKPAVACELESGRAYRAELVDPSTGQAHDLGEVHGDAEGRWAMPQAPAFHDWVLALTPAGS